MLSYNNGGGFPLAGTFAVLLLSIPVVIYLVLFGLSLPDSPNESASTDSQPAGRSSPVSPTVPAAVPSGVSSSNTAPSQIREYGTGDVIGLSSRPGASLIVTNLEWRDRLARPTEADGISYVDPGLGRFLVVTYEFTNGTDAPVDLADAIAPVLEDEAGNRYRPAPMSGAIDANEEPIIVPQGEMIASGSAVTGVRFFDVRNGFAGGYLYSAADDYRLAVGPGQ